MRGIVNESEFEAYAQTRRRDLACRMRKFMERTSCTTYDFAKQTALCWDTINDALKEKKITQASLYRIERLMEHERKTNGGGLKALFDNYLSNWKKVNIKDWCLPEKIRLKDEKEDRNTNDTIQPPGT